MIQIVADASLARPWIVLIGWILVSLMSVAGIERLEVDTQTSSFLDRESAKWDFYQASRTQFGNDEFISVVVSGEEAYDVSVLNRILELSRSLERLPGVRRVDSLATFDSVISDKEGSLRFGLILEENVRSPIEAQQISKAVGRDRIARKHLVSEDGRSFAINVYFAGDVDASRSAALSKLEELVGEGNEWYSGVPVFRSEVNRQTQRELQLYGPVTVGLIAFVVLLGFQSLSAALTAVVCSSVGVLIILGLMGALGTPVSLSTVMLPPILIAVGCAYFVHMYAAIWRCTDRDELRSAVRRVSEAIALSGLTTSIGFLSMTTIPVDAIRELGAYGAVGVLLALACALTVPPALARLRWVCVDRRERRLSVNAGVSLWLSRTVGSNRWLIVFIWSAIGICFGVGVGQVQIDTDIIRWFAPQAKARISYEEIRARVSGITPVNVIIEGRDGRYVTEPEALARIEAFSRYIESLPGVGSALSIADIIAQIHAEFGGAATGELPEERELVEQYLAILPSRRYVEEGVSHDRRSANVVIRSNVNGSKEIMNLADKIETWWISHGVDGYDISVTGVMYEFGRAEEAIAYGQLRGLGVAFAAIAVILIALLRNTRMVFFALLGNVLPVVIVYGGMSFLSVPLDAATICVGCIALGIGVDDTIHVVVGYQDKLSGGMLARRAVEQALEPIVYPLLLTTIAVCVGFLVLTASDFALVQRFGVVTAIVVLLCLLADLTLLPAALSGTAGWRGGQAGAASRDLRVG